MADEKKNPRNPQSPLFQRLTKLFSGPIVNYQAQQTRNNRKFRADMYSPKFKSVGGQTFKRKSYNPYESISTALMNNLDRATRYADFDQMEFMPELASALDIYADEITASSHFKDSVLIECPNEEIRGILETLFYKVLNVNFNLFGWVRTMVKYGDFISYMDIDDTLGVQSLIGLPSIEIERMEGQDPTNPSYIQYQWNTGGLTFENWQVAHFRILANDKYAPYGTSILDPARRVWRQLILLEDAMIAYRIVRAPDRRMFKIDVGGIPPEEVEQYMQKIMTQMKRHQVVNDKTGQVDLRYNPMSIEEDYFVPVRNGTAATEITTIPGNSWKNDIDDVKYLRDKLFAAIKIPAAYLSRAEGAGEGEQALSQKDIRFARTIQRIQRSVVSGLEKIAIVHLYTIGYRASDLLNFSIKLHNPSRIAVMQEIETLSSKLDIADKAMTNWYSKSWISKNVLDLSEDEFVRNQRERFYDKKVDASMAAIAEVAGAEAGATAMAGMDPGAIDLAGEPAADLGEEPTADLGGESPEAPAPEAESPEDILLSSPEGGPGKRDIDNEIEELKWVKKNLFTGKEKTSTPKSNDKWYERVTVDKRTTSAPRKKHYRQLPQKGRRAKFGSSLYNGIVNENKSNYSEEVEHDLLNLNREIKSLINGLEKREEKNEAQ
tara:strand:- start:3993 stop:5978 length:1986 start_codon:yes stop_codon:yes gene_type:complete